MACNFSLNNNIVLGCNPYIGGASAVYLIGHYALDKEATIDALTDPANTTINKLILPDIILKSGVTDKFIKIECPNGVINSTSNIAKNEQNRTSAITQTLIFHLYNAEMADTQSNVDFLEFLSALNGGRFFVLVKFASGDVQTFGFDNGAVLTSSAGQSGVASADMSGKIITLTASAEMSEPFFVNPSVLDDTNLITPATI